MVDDPLLVPAGRRMLLTARAAGLREPLTASLDGLRGLLRPPRAFDPATAIGTVRMAATEHALGAVVHEFVGRLMRRAPLLDVQIEPAGRDVFSQLAAGRLELLVVPKVGRLPEELRTADLLHERFLSVVRQDHPVAQRKLTLRHPPVCSGTGSRRRAPLACLKPPLAIPGFVLQAVWHRRHDDDPLQLWLRDVLESTLKK